jgi:hypothetical protein
VFPAVAASPSGPPSNTCMRPVSQMLRRSDCTEPGRTALAVVDTSHIPPIAVTAVSAQTIVTGNSVSITVAGVPPPSPLKRSVMRSS